MAWGARLGLKHQINPAIQAAIGRLNGLGSPFGFETSHQRSFVQMCSWLNGLGSPFGFETLYLRQSSKQLGRLNGLGSPFGFETSHTRAYVSIQPPAKW